VNSESLPGGKASCLHGRLGQAPRGSRQMDGMHMPVIEAVNVSKRFAEVEALKDVTLTVHEGDFFGLFGPNGAGKTTLLRILTGQILPDSGSATTAGVSSHDAIGVKRAVGIVPEAETPPSFMTAQELLELTCRIRGLDGIRERVDRWLAFFEVEDKRDVLCKDLSKGQRQKMMLASAFIHEPRLLLLDEPFSSLDVDTKYEMYELVQRLWKDTECAVLMVTHDLHEAIMLGSRIFVSSARPLIKRDIIEVPFERPRSDEMSSTEKYLEIRRHLTRLLRRSGQKFVIRSLLNT